MNDAVSRAVLRPQTLICSLLMAASMVMVLWNLQDASLKNANTGSRFATIESLVDYGTYHINKSRYVHTIDKYKVGKYYISSKPPALPTYAAGAYWVYQQFTGKTIRRHEGDVVRFVSFMTGGLAHLLFLIFFYRLCLLLLSRQLAIISAMAAASFAYLGVGYATHINNHSIAAALSTVGLYYAVRIRRGKRPRVWHYPIAGLCLGVLPAIDLPSLGFSGLLTLYLMTHDFKRTSLWFVPALLPGLVCHFALSYTITGSLLPFQVNSELKNFKGFHFRNAGGIDGLREPKTLYAFNVLFGHHGLFSMTPLFVFGAWELLRSLWRRVRLAESLVVAMAVLALLAFYIVRTRNYGGWCVGMRWLVPVMPLLLLYFGLWLDRVRITRGVWSLVLAAFVVSSFHVQDALSSPFQFSVWHNLLDGKPNRNRVGKRFNEPKRKSKKKRRRKTSKPRRTKAPSTAPSSAAVPTTPKAAAVPQQDRAAPRPTSTTPASAAPPLH